MIHRNQLSRITALLMVVLIFMLCFIGCNGKGADGSKGKIGEVADLSGRTVAVCQGTVHDRLILDIVPDANIVYYASYADMLTALAAGKVDALVGDTPSIAFATHEAEVDSAILPGELYVQDVGEIFPLGSKLCDEFNEFLESYSELDELKSKWIDGKDPELDTPISDVPNTKGRVIKFATESLNPPFAYMKDGKLVGYEIELVEKFCLAKGYGLEISDVTFGSILPGVTENVYDMAGSSITITDERRESLKFSNPVYRSGASVVVRPQDAEYAHDSDAEHRNVIGQYANSIASSFDKTFVREGRWKLFALGIGSTMLITVLSIIFGTALGFLIYLGYKRENPLFNKIVDFFSWLLQGMPTVVFLMILFYIVFAHTSLSGTGVATVGFSMTFAISVLGMLNTSVASIDKGQSEAALALGYSEGATFFKMVLPQAAQFFLPLFKSEIVSLIKGTAVVGYIAVQDLTKMGDIVRSRTYEAFFPLIVTAIIYFILAGILTAIVSRIEIRIDPKRRDVSKLMKGADEE